jgi:putative salt-induced outer membrane protein YdiY
MKAVNKIFAFAGMLAVLCGVASAKANTVTVTNFVTVTITNVVTVTNIVPPMPVSAATAAIAAAVPPTPPAKPSLPPKYPWQNAVSLGLTMTRGNSDTTLFTADYLAQRKTPFDEYKIDVNGSYGDQDSRETVNNYKAYAQWNHLFTPRFYTYGRVDGLRDIIADVNYRANIGPGLGYYLLKDTNTTLAAEGGGSFEGQRLDDTGDQTFATLRLADRFEHKVNDHVRLWENAEILPQVDDFDNYIVNFEAGVEASLSKSFSLKTFLDDNYDNNPAPGKLKNDAKIVAALGYKF